MNDDKAGRAGFLRGPRRAALAAITALVGASSLVSFGESYRGLYLWAGHHGLSGVWVAIWPLMVDTFIAVGELSLFVALADHWPPRSRFAAWTVTLAGLAVSVAANVGHVTGHSLANRATAAVPPLAAAAALAVGLGVLKRVVGARLAGHQVAMRVATDRPARLATKRPRPVAKAGHGHRSQADIEAAVLSALAASPDMTHRELAAATGTSERTARRYRSRLATVNGQATDVATST